MPPPGQGSPQSNAGQNHTEPVEPYYSNDDIALLHDVVILAQEIFPSLPERERLSTNALFGAYYELLPRFGIDTDHDNRYARILFKIGGQRGPATLYEKFEAVLAKMGIEIEFDHENNDGGKEQSLQEDSQVGIDSNIISRKSTPTKNDNPRRMHRRNSESSAWDLGIDFKSQPTTRRNSFSTIGKDHSRIVVEKNIFQRGQATSTQGNDTHSSAPKKDGTNRSVGAWLNSRSEKPRKGRGRSVSTHRSLRVRRRSESRDHEGQQAQPMTPSIAPSESDLTNSDITAASSTFEEEAVPNWTQVVVHRPAPKPENLLGIKATLSYQARLQTLIKHMLRNWRDRARDLQQDNYGLELIAISHGKRALSRSVFSIWRNLLHEKRKSAETERIFAKIGQDASDVRQHIIAQRALYHWVNYANFHVHRTAVARRHIVGTRVYNAWKQITVVNELKVRRHVLKRLFGAWRRRYTASVEEGLSAIQRYEGNLAENICRQWLRKLWEVKAIKWRSETTKRQALFRWIVVSHNHWESRRSAEEVRRQDLAWNTWALWKTKTESQIRHDQDATVHYQKRLVRGPILKWRRETKIVPAKVQVQTKVAIGTLRDALSIWRLRTFQEREAARLNRLKILREGLAVWCYKFRSILMVNRIEKRLLAKAFSMLQLREIDTTVQRQQRQRLLHDAFYCWKQKANIASQRRYEQEELARSLITWKTQTDVLHTWAFRADARKQLNTAATEFHDPRLLQNHVTKWTARAQHLKELDRRSHDANYYVVLTNAIKRWKNATETSKREKRKSAFAQVKRMVKTNLARGILINWREQAHNTLSLQAQATGVSDNKAVILGMELFDRWRARTEELAELDILWQEMSLMKYFKTWRSRSNAVQALKTEATLTYQEQRESRVVKQWSLLALKIKAQDNYAANIREKNVKKNFRKMFSYWRQKALQKRPVKKVAFAESSQTSTTAKAEAWSDFGEDLEMDDWARGLDDPGAVSTPIPGYLSTPSKRSERVMAVAVRFSTTPKAPLSTPFERQLRAQWSGGTPSHRRPLARSTLGIDRGFADIPESSVNDDQEPRR